jgi:hypothetical protein
MGFHTREFLAAAAGMTGQSTVARQADDSLFVQLRFNQWQEVLQRPRPTGGVSLLEWHVAQVLALVGLRRTEDADAARAAYATFETTLPNDAQWWADPVGRFLPMVRHEMDARIAWAKGHRPEAISQWMQGIAAQDGLTRLESVMPWFHSRPVDRRAYRPGPTYRIARARGSVTRSSVVRSHAPSVAAAS